MSKEGNRGQKEDFFSRQKFVKENGKEQQNTQKDSEIYCVVSSRVNSSAIRFSPVVFCVVRLGASSQFILPLPANELFPTAAGCTCSQQCFRRAAASEGKIGV